MQFGVFEFWWLKNIKSHKTTKSPKYTKKFTELLLSSCA